MKSRKLKAIVLVLSFALVALPFVAAHAAGGRIEGKVTDPKGAVVSGATITVTDPATNQTFSAITDDQGRYKIEGLIAGTYTVTISAKGFTNARREDVKVADGATATFDAKLEIAAVEAAVNVASAKANADPAYQMLRQIGKGAQDFGGPFATVTNLALTRDAAVFTLRSGEIYFSTPVEGRTTAAVFVGDGELTLVPPTPVEKRSLAIFVDNEQLTEPFNQLVVRFTDKTFDEIKSSANAKMGTGGPQASKARDLYRENQQLLRKELHDNGELRALADLYAPEHPGYFNSFIGGGKHSKLIFLLDPLGIPQVSPEEVALLSYGQTDGGFWTAFHLADEYAKGTASSSEDHRLIDITHHQIDGAIKGTRITASDLITFRSVATGTRVLPFNLYRSLRVNRVSDEQGKDLSFVQEGKDDDADFGVILPQALEAGKTYKLKVEYDGEGALRDSGGGNYILGPRSTWYPANASNAFGEDRAIYDMTFSYPKGHMFVGTGAPVAAETNDGDVIVAKWSSGTTELDVAGFNYGRFKKKEVLDKESGYNIEFYANIEVPNELKQIQAEIERIERSSPGNARNLTGTTLGSISTTQMADTAIADAENATRIFNAYFGKLPYTRMAMTQQPAGFFGQAWPTLVFMPYIAFLDTTQRTQLLGARGGTDNFWRYVEPHEISHQWWGHIVGWDSYHDQWMSEGFAEFSASLYVQATRGNDKFIDFWEDHRKQIIQSSPATRDKKPYTIGPVTQGYRLSNAKTGAAYQFLVYPKGAFILHMLRMMMYNRGGKGDEKFQAMMKDFIQTHFNQDISTEDFRESVEKHLGGKMDWFFNEWVYGTEMPSYRFDYQLSDGGTTLTGKITQSGVSDQFKMLVPVYADFGKGWVKVGAGMMTGNTSVDLTGVKLPQAAKRAAVCALDDILALSIQNSK
jgi:hypothetical protein